jgi:hypothetical protein
MRFKDVVKVVKEEVKEYGSGRKKGYFQTLEIESTCLTGHATIFLDNEDEALEKGKEYAVEMYQTISQDKNDRFWINWNIVPESVKEK